MAGDGGWDWGLGSGLGVEVWKLVRVVGSLGFGLGVAMLSSIASGEVEWRGEICMGIVCCWWQD